MATSDLSHLFSPLSIGKLQLRNRIVLPPMGNRYPSFGGRVTERLIRYYVEMARGGVGLVIVQFACVTSAGRSSYYPLGIWNDDQIPGLRRINDPVIVIDQGAGRFHEQDRILRDRHVQLPGVILIIEADTNDLGWF